MAKNTSITLSQHFDEFLDERIASGRFESKSEAVRAGLRLLEVQERGLMDLQKALLAGENSGQSTPFDFQDFLAKKHNEVKPK